jgi:hypothetical protein
MQLTERVRYQHLPPVDPALLECPAIHVELERRSSLPLLEQRFRSVALVKTIVRSQQGAALANYPVYLVANPVGDTVFSLDRGAVR